jgi:hypothetical protein
MKKITISLLFFLGFITANLAQTSYVWNGATSTAWGTSTNWTPNGNPGAIDNVTIVTGGNTCILPASQSVTNLTITSGVLNLGGNTLTVSGIFSGAAGSCTNGTLSLTGSSQTFSGTTFGANVSVVPAATNDVYFNGSTFNGTLNVTRNNSTNIQSTGNNIYNAATTITNAGTGYLLLTNTAARTETFNAAVNLGCTNTGNLYIGYNGSATYNAVPTINNVTSTGDVFLGGNTGTTTLASGIGITTGAFTGSGVLRIYKLVQASATALTLNVGSVGGVGIFGGSTVTGVLTVTAGNIYVATSTFNGNVTLNKTAGTNNASAGGNTFNGTVTLNHSGVGYWGFGNGTADIFNGNLTINNTCANERVIIGQNSSNNQFNGNVTVTQSGTAQGTWLGFGGVVPVIALAAGKTINVSAATVTAGYVNLYGFVQAGAGALAYSVASTAGLGVYSSTINGTFSLTGGDIYCQSSTFAAAVTLNKNGGTNDASGGGNTFNGTLTLNHSGIGYWGFGNGTADIFNGDLYLTNTCANERILIGQNSTNNQCNGNVYVSSSGTAQNIWLGWGGAYPIVQMAATKSVIVGAGGFSAGGVVFNKFAQSDATPITLAGTGTSVVTIQGSTIFTGATSFTAADIYVQGGTFNGAASFTKTGATSNHNNGNLNTFNSTCTINQQGTGYFMLGYNSADAFNDNITVTSTNTGIIYLGWTGGGTGTPTLAAGKTISVGGAGFSSGGLSFNTFTQLGNAAINLTLTGAATTLTFARSSVFGGNLTCTSPDLLFNGATFNGVVTATKTGATNDVGTGGNTFATTGLFTNNGNGYLMLGNTTADIFNGDVTFTNTGAERILPAWNSGGNQFNGNITLNSTGSSLGINFCGGSVTGTATQAAAKNISIGGSGYTAGYLVFQRFTQLGTSAVNLTLGAAANYLQFGPTSSFGGNITCNAPGLFFNSSTFAGTVDGTKTGSTNDASVGGNTFNGTTNLTNTGSGYFLMGNGSADIFNGVTTFNNNGTYRIYVAYNHAGQTTTFATDVTFNANKTGGADAWSYLIGEGSTSNLSFGGNVTFNIAGAVQSNMRILTGAGTVASYAGNTTLNVTNTNASTVMQMGNTGISTYNGNIIVSNSGGSSGITFNSTATASSTLANTKTISIGAGGYSAGSLLLYRFTQIGGTAQALALTGTGILTVGPASAFGGNVNFISPELYLNGCAYSGAATLEKNGAVNDASVGGNTFNGTTTITNSGSGYFLMGNGAVDIWNADVTFSNTGSNIMYLAYNSTGNQINGNVAFNSTGSSTGIYFCAANVTSTVIQAAGFGITIGGLGYTSGYLILKQFTQLGNAAINMTFGAAASYLQFGPTSSFGGNVTSNTPGLFFNTTTFAGTVDATKTGASSDASIGGNTFGSTTTITHTGSGQFTLGNGSADIFNGVTTFNNNGSYRFLVANNHAGATTTFATDVTFNSAKTGGVDQWSFLNAESANTLISFGGNVTINNSGVLQSNCRILQGAGATASYAGNLTINVTNTNAGTAIQMGTVGTSTYNGNIIVSNSGGASGVYFNTSATASSTLANTKTITIGGGGFNAGTLSLIRFTQIGGTPQALTLTGTGILTVGPTSAFGGNVNFLSPQVYLNGCTYSGTATIEKNGATDNGSLGGNIFNGVTTLTNSGSGYLMMGSTSADAFNAVTTLNNYGSYRFFLAYNHTALTTTFATDVTFNSAKTGGVDAWSFFVCDGNNTNVAFGGNVTINNSSALQSNCRFLQGTGTTASYAGTLTIALTNSNAGTSMSMGVNGISSYNGNIVVTNTGGAAGIYFNTTAGTSSSTLANTKTISVGAGGFTAGGLYLYRFTQVGGTAQNLTLTGTSLLQFGPTSVFGGNVTCSSPSLLFNGCTFNGTHTGTKTGTTNDAGIGNNIFNGVTNLTNSGSGYLMFGNGNADAFNTTTTFNNTGSSYIYAAYNGTGNTFGGDVTFNNAPTTAAAYILVANFGINTQFNGNIIVTSTNGSGVQFCQNTGNATLAATKTISVGGAGFSVGTLLLRNFVQTGATAQSLTLTGAGNLTFGPGSTFGGDVTSVSPTLFFNGCTFSGLTTCTKNGTTNDAGTGGNIFTGVSVMNNSGAGYLLFGNGTPDQWLTHVTFNNTGSNIIYPAYNSLNNTFGGNATLNNVGSTGNSAGIYVCAAGSATGSLTGNLIVNNNPASGTNNGVRFCEGANSSFSIGGTSNITNTNTNTSNYIRFSTGAGSTTTFGGDVTATNNGTVASTNVIHFGYTGSSVFNGNITLTSTGGNGITFGIGAGINTQANNKTVNTSGFTGGPLSFRNFTQSGPTTGNASNVSISGTNMLLSFNASSFYDNVTASSQMIDCITSTFRNAATLTKVSGNGNNYWTGGNTFNGTTTITNQSTFILGMANGTADAYNGNVTFVQSGTGIVSPNYNANCTYAGNITVTTPAGVAMNFGTAAGGIATINGSNTPQTISLTAGNTPIFTRLTMSKTANDLTLATPINVSTLLTLTTGNIVTTSPFILTMQNASTTNIGSASSYINGPMNYDMALNGARTLTFPIGKSGDWRPAVLALTHNAATSYTYKAEVTNSPATFLAWTLPATVDTVSGVRYWDIDRTVTAGGAAASATNLSGNQTITLYFDVNDYVYQGANLTIVKNTNASPTTWFDIGGSCALGNSASPQAGSVSSTSAPTAFTSFSRFTLGSKNAGWNSLPVEMLYLKAKPVGSDVQLDWATATETNNDHYNVERSKDAITFEYVSTVRAHGNGNSTTTQQYLAMDNNPYSGTSYYRLKQVDKNGDFKYSTVVEVNFTKKSFVNVYPNPAYNNLTIEASNDYMNASVKITNALGEEVINSILNSYSNLIDVSGLQSGFYYVLIDNGNGIAKTKITVQK